MISGDICGLICKKRLQGAELPKQHVFIQIYGTCVPASQQGIQFTTHKHESYHMATLVYETDDQLKHHLY